MAKSCVNKDELMHMTFGSYERATPISCRTSPRCDPRHINTLQAQYTMVLNILRFAVLLMYNSNIYDSPRPSNVGILAMEVYFPNRVCTAYNKGPPLTVH